MALAMMLALTLAASAWLAEQSDADPATLLVAVRTATGARPAPFQLPVLRQPGAAWPPLTPAAAAAWRPPPPPAPQAPVVALAADPPLPPPPPKAPPLGYRWVGRLDNGGVVYAVLNGPNRTLSAKEGDLLDGQWRVDRIEASTIHLTWLPAMLDHILAYAKP